jgi:hypothetical protein
VAVYFGSATSFMVTGRTDGDYYYRVRGVSNVGASDWTEGPNPCTVAVAQGALLLTEGRANPGAGTERHSAQDVPMLHMKFTAGSFESVQVQSIAVHSSGTGEEMIGIANVELWHDLDGDGVIDPSDVQVGTGTFPAEDGLVTFDTTSEAPVPAGGTDWYLVVCDFSDQALTSHTFQFLVSPGTDVTSEGVTTTNAIAVAGAGVVGGEKTIDNSGIGSLHLSVGTGGTSAEAVTTPASGVTMMVLTFTASAEEDVNVVGVKFASLGTGDETAGVLALLYVDSDGSGGYSTGDAGLGSTAFTVDNGTASFSFPTPLTVTAGSSASVVLVYDFPETVQTGTFAAMVEFGESVDAYGATSAMGITASGAPLFGSEKVIQDLDTVEPTGMFGDCGGVAGSASWLTWLLGFAFLGATAALARLRRRV